MTQLDRIEQKLDRLLILMGSKPENDQVQDFKAALATGGWEGLKSYVQGMPTKKGADR